MRDRQLGFIDEQQTVDDYKAVLRSECITNYAAHRVLNSIQGAKTPKATKEVVRERLTFHREI